jgi:hypothetical protein
MPEMNEAVWPDIPLEEWSETCATLHMWLQIVGKVRLVQSPWVNHSWTRRWRLLKSSRSAPVHAGPRLRTVAEPGKLGSSVHASFAAFRGPGECLAASAPVPVRLWVSLAQLPFTGDSTALAAAAGGAGLGSNHVTSFMDSGRIVIVWNNVLKRPLLIEVFEHLARMSSASIRN